MPSTDQTSRLSAGEIFERVEAGAHEELIRPVHNLAISAVSAGLAMGLSGLGVAVLLSVLGSDRVGETVAYAAYPLGFLIVIIGRQQLFTENTLFPVALVLAERKRLWVTLRLWAVVLGGNATGAAMFAVLASQTPAVPEDIRRELVRLGAETGSQGFAAIFWTGVIAGWLIALVAWLVTASRDTVGQVLIIFFITFVVGVGHFAHSIAGMAEVYTAVFTGEVPMTSALTWVSAAVLGNTAGGVLIVALFNYGQVHRVSELTVEQD